MNKINKNTLIKKLEQLIPSDKEAFKRDLEHFRSILIKNKPNYRKPLLVHATINKAAIFYMIIVYFSLQAGRILDFVITTGQNIITQHFLDNENKDMDFNSKLYHDDILFITVSRSDYTSEYLESLIVDLVETRNYNGKATIVIYDSADMSSYLNKLFSYFNSIDSKILQTTPQRINTNKPTKKKGKVEFF